VWATAVGAPLAAAVTLFGVLHWTVELAPLWWGNPFGIAHAVDPLEGRNLGDRIVTPLLLEPGWKAGRGAERDALVIGLNKLRRHWEKQQRNRAVDLAIDRIMAEVADGNDTIEGDRIPILINRLAEWTSHYYLRLSMRTDLDPEETLRRVEQEYPAFCTALDRQ
jgi:hypothetical protein